VRTLCRACRRAYDVGHSDEIAETVALFETEAPSTVFAPGEGCVSCQGSGYSGRTGLFEVLGFNTELRRLTARMAVSREIHQAAVDNGMVDFRKSAMLKVSQGLTNIEDLLRDVPAECLGLED
ncbi:MAG: type II/IV secretion system protein, partial [Pirellulaceae bacterium]|nr:type II/IV secretion system protein [Pirellulaceae bacterium]